MRKLGGALGVEAMSLYHYVANKDDLLDAMLDVLYAEIELPYDTPAEDWDTAVRGGLRAFYDVLLAHPAALELFSSRPVPSERAYAVLVWGVERFVNVGVDLDDAHPALHVAVSYVMGHAATELGIMSATAADLGLLPEEVCSNEVAAFMQRSRESTGDELFEAGLDVLIAGLRARYGLP